MDQDTSLAISRDARLLARKSWTAYVRLVFLGLAGLLLVGAASYAHWIAGLVALAVIGGALTYQVLEVRSHKLYIDDIGVWRTGGVLPWKKGVAGVKWRDLDEAVFEQGMGSWLLKSYTVRIGHRFTKANEIVMTDMARGHEAVMTINATHQELVRQGKLG